MVRLEIKELFTECSGERVPACVPYSAVEETVIYAPIRISGAMVDRRYAYLSVPATVGEAEIFLGDVSIGKTSDRERKSFDIKPLLRIGETEFKIKLSSGAILVGMPVLLSFNSAAIDGIHVAQRHEGGSVMLDIKLRTLGCADGVKAIATLVSGAGQIYYGGITRGYGSIKVKDPLYWWPRGLGVANLYRLTVNLYGESDVEDSEELVVGLRSGEVVRDGGVSLSFNELPFVPMGALYRLPDTAQINERLSREIKALARGGANAVYLDKSLKYIPSELLDLCDKEGLAVICEVCDMKAVGALEALSNHASLSFAVIPEGQGSDAIYTAARGAAPDAAIILERESEFAIIDAPASLPEEKTLGALGTERERNPLATDLIALGGEAYRDVLLRVMDEYLYPSGPRELGYLTRLYQSRAVEERIAEARLARGEGLSFAVYSELSDSECRPSGSAIDAFGRKKLLYYRASRAFSPVYATARRTDAGADITVINDRRTELSGRAYYRVIDSSNNLVYNYAEEISVPATSRVTIEAVLSEFIADRLCECYLEYGIISYDAQYSDTLLFVKPKDFHFERPNLKVRVDGGGEDFSITLFSDRFTAGVEILFDSADLELSDNGFDITSPAPVKLSARLLSGKKSAEEIEAKIRINCLNVIGFDN